MYNNKINFNKKIPQYRSIFDVYILKVYCHFHSFSFSFKCKIRLWLFLRIKNENPKHF